MELFLLFKLATRWKNVVHLSPSLSQRALYFCRQLISSIRVTFSNSLITNDFVNFSSKIKAPTSSNPSRTQLLHKKFYMGLHIAKHLLILGF